MPQRTNDFQKLVLGIQRSLMPHGAKITESAIMETVNGRKREVDVVVESAMGPYRMVIAVEVKDESRPLAETVIEQYGTKFSAGDGILVNKVVIVSSSGFTIGARERARERGFELLTLRQAEEADWAAAVPPDRPVGITLQGPPRVVGFYMRPAVEGLRFTKESIETLRVVCACCGRLRGTLREFVTDSFNRHVLSDPRFRTEQIDLLKKIRDEAITKPGGDIDTNIKFEATWKYDRGIYVLEDSQRHVFNTFVINSSMRVSFCRSTLTSYVQEDTSGTRKTIQRAVAKLFGKQMQAIFPNGLKGGSMYLDDMAATKPAGADANQLGSLTKPRNYAVPHRTSKRLGKRRTPPQ